MPHFPVTFYKTIRFTKFRFVQEAYIKFNVRECISVDKNSPSSYIRIFESLVGSRLPTGKNRTAPNSTVSKGVSSFAAVAALEKKRTQSGQTLERRFTDRSLVRTSRGPREGCIMRAARGRENRVL